MEREQLRHLTKKHSFIGKARYRRTIDIPKQLAGKPLRVKLERVLWRSTMSIDGHDTGQTQESLVAPHIFHIKDGLTEGRHEITLDIDNRQIYRISNGMAHAYTDETQTKWNGVLGEMTLEAEPLITDVKVMEDAA